MVTLYIFREDYVNLYMYYVYIPVVERVDAGLAGAGLAGAGLARAAGLAAAGTTVSAFSAVGEEDGKEIQSCLSR